MTRCILVGILLLSLTLAGCASIALEAGRIAEADLTKQQLWIAQMEAIVEDQVDDFRLEIKLLARDNFEAAMAMRLELLEFMEQWRPRLVIERLFERLRAIKARATREAAP